jgi:hypothetical protein
VRLVRARHLPLAYSASEVGDRRWREQLATASKGKCLALAAEEIADDLF